MFGLVHIETAMYHLLINPDITVYVYVILSHESLCHKRRAHLKLHHSLMLIQTMERKRTKPMAVSIFGPIYSREK